MIDKPYKQRTKRRHKQTLHMETKKAISSLIITLTLMIVALSVIFLIITSKSSQLGYTLQQEKLKNEHLKIENQNLNTQVTESTASSEIKDENKLNKMTTPEEKIYVTEEDNRVK